MRRGRDPVFRAGVIGMLIALVLGVLAVFYGMHALNSPRTQVASESKEPTFDPLVRSDAPNKAWREQSREVQSGNEEPAPKEPERSESRSEPRPEPQPQEPPASEPASSPDPKPLPDLDVPDWPAPEDSEVEEASDERDYGSLPPGAVLGLSVPALGVYNAPVMGSDSAENLDQGVVHIPETSMPWSNTPERNTYLAAHRIGYPGTGSRLLFYNLDHLQKGDEVTLESRQGKEYTYRVSEVFVVTPYDSWVMGRVTNRDMVTLQTCTPIPTFENRLIVRADRV